MSLRPGGAAAPRASSKGRLDEVLAIGLRSVSLRNGSSTCLPCKPAGGADIAGATITTLQALNEPCSICREPLLSKAVPPKDAKGEPQLDHYGYTPEPDELFTDEPRCAFDEEELRAIWATSCTTPRAHFLHKVCAKMLVENSSTPKCPVCKTEFTDDEIKQLRGRKRGLGKEGARQITQAIRRVRQQEQRQTIAQQQRDTALWNLYRNERDVNVPNTTDLMTRVEARVSAWTTDEFGPAALAQRDPADRSMPNLWQLLSGGAFTTAPPLVTNSQAVGWVAMRVVYHTTPSPGSSITTPFDDENAMAEYYRMLLGYTAVEPGINLQAPEYGDRDQL